MIHLPEYWQNWPVNPAGHEHTPSVQTPPFRQLSAQSRAENEVKG